MDKSKPVWKWWYSGCIVQNLYIVLTIIGGLLLGALVFALMFAKIPKDSKNEYYNDSIKLLQKYKFELVFAFVLAFILSFVIDNLLLVWYCNTKTKGVANLVWSLILWFIVLPVINSMITYMFMMIMLRDFIADMQKLQQKYQKIMDIKPIK